MMQFVPSRTDLEQALRKAKVQVVTAPPGRSPEIEKIHDIFLNTPIPPEIFENYRSGNKTPKPQPAQPKPRKQRDLQAELRELNLIPAANEGPKRGSGTIFPQQEAPGLPGFPGMPAVPLFNHPHIQPRNRRADPNNMDPNNYEDFQENEEEEEENHEGENQNDGLDE